MSDAEILETERLILRKPAAVDAENLARLGNDRTITDQLATMPFPYTTQDAMSWISAVGDMESGAAFLIIEQTTQQPVGCCGSGPVDDKDEIDFGYWLGTNFWGQGYASEAGHAVLNHVFVRYGFEVITTDCLIDNRASLRVLEKLGFRRSGCRERFSVAVGKNVKTVKMQLFGKDWRHQNPCTGSRTV